MVTKKKVIKKKIVKPVKKVSKKFKKVKAIRVVKDPWFRATNKKQSWGFVPVNSKGGIALVILVGLNVFAANYFRLNYLIFDNWSKFGVVFLLSIFIFIMISKRKTKRI